jgi:hypothetical protein
VDHLELDRLLFEPVRIRVQVAVFEELTVLLVGSFSVDWTARRVAGCFAFCRFRIARLMGLREGLSGRGCAVVELILN